MSLQHEEQLSFGGADGEGATASGGCRVGPDRLTAVRWGPPLRGGASLEPEARPSCHEHEACSQPPSLGAPARFVALGMCLPQGDGDLFPMGTWLLQGDRESRSVPPSWAPLCATVAPSAILWRQLHWHPFTGITVGLRFFFLFFFSFYVHIMCVCVKVVFWKTSLFIDDVIVIVLFFWLINCLLSLLCMPAKISHTSSWKGYEETSNWNHNHLIMRVIWKIIFQPKTCLISKSGFY